MFACVIAYVVVALPTAPGANILGVTTKPVTPITASSMVKLLTVTFPVLVTVKL